MSASAVDSAAHLLALLSVYRPAIPSPDRVESGGGETVLVWGELSILCHASDGEPLFTVFADGAAVDASVGVGKTFATFVDLRKQLVAPSS